MYTNYIGSMALQVGNELFKTQLAEIMHICNYHSLNTSKIITKRTHNMNIMCTVYENN